MATPASPNGNFLRLAGRRVLITGAGGGVGRALMQAFNTAGAIVFGADRDAALLAPLELARRLVFDLCDPAGIEAAMTDLVQSAVPDTVISNAGWTGADRLEHVDASA
ncbi:MAG: SDR family NAD(P)-dependent oxidoreductase [Acetobacteraceae bacterium]|nr:SDR family NAD(P)-dependent oxidoreductase [Acetobacteraceae bacterium]